MRILILSLGNQLRRDDGAAHHVLNRLQPTAKVEARALFQLTPEVAQEIANFQVVLFIDADASVAAVTLESLEPSLVKETPLTHVSRPRGVVALSRALFGFAGKAFLCRIPVEDLSAGEGLSSRANASSDDAVRQVGALIEELGVT